MSLDSATDAQNPFCVLFVCPAREHPYLEGLSLTDENFLWLDIPRGIPDSSSECDEKSSENSSWEEEEQEISLQI
jgi:hypothetical protein